MQRVALLGLGTMGAGMAANWLAKGFDLTVWNRTRARTHALADKGARVATTPREAAEGADCVFAMVADDTASRAVWLGDDGALAGAKTGAVVVESSTLTPDWVRELAGRARAKGCAFLDAPVGGSRQAAASGELRLFVGGDARQGAACAYRNRKQDRLARTGGRRGDLEAHQQPAHRRPGRRSGRSARCGAEGRFPAGADLQSHPQRRRIEPDREDETAEHA